MAQTFISGSLLQVWQEPVHHCVRRVRGRENCLSQVRHEIFCNGWGISGRDAGGAESTGIQPHHGGECEPFISTLSQLNPIIEMSENTTRSILSWWCCNSQRGEWSPVSQFYLITTPSWRWVQAPHVNSISTQPQPHGGEYVPCISTQPHNGDEWEHHSFYFNMMKFKSLSVGQFVLDVSISSLNLLSKIS